MEGYIHYVDKEHTHTQNKTKREWKLRKGQQHENSNDLEVCLSFIKYTHSMRQAAIWKYVCGEN